MNVDFLDALKLDILERYHPDLVDAWKRGVIDDIHLYFETYLRWIVDTPNEARNEHFAPIIDLAQPRRVMYNYILW